MPLETYIPLYSKLSEGALFMTISKTAVAQLGKNHPHSVELLEAFVPLINTQYKLVQAPDAASNVQIPPLDEQAFAAGKAWMQAAALPCTPAFLKKSCTQLCNAAVKALPKQADAFGALKDFFKSHPGELRELANFHLRGTLEAAKLWAQQHGLSPEPTALLSTLLGGTLAQTARAAAEMQVDTRPEYQAALNGWKKGCCPVCGSVPHGSSLRHKEGERYLHCSLCGHAWRYPRTACPLCEQQDAAKISLFFIEDRPEERAESCDVCKHYLLSVDTRAWADESLPLSLYFLCMAPLDLLMQEKGYAPAENVFSS